MQKKGELSRLAVNLLIGFLIIVLGVVIFFIVRGYMNDGSQEVFTDENIDLKISQVKTVDDNTLDLTLKRSTGEGEFVGLSFAVSDGSLTEVVRLNSSMIENESGNFSLNFILVNASKVKKISVTPIYINEDGIEVIGNVKDEYITPNTCSNYCPVGAQCGFNDCGMQCGNGCSSGYLCLNYKCIKQQTSSGGSGGGGSGGGGGSDDETCTDTCSSLGYQCGTQSICNKSVNCETCQTGYTCSTNSTCIKNSQNCTDTCSTFGYNCGIRNICNISTNCGTCSSGFTCNITSLCECNSTCSSLGYQCGTRTVCGNSVNCGTCSTGYTCQVSNGTCMKNCVPITCSALDRTCGTVSNGCSGTLNCGTCSTGYTCQVNGTCIKDVVVSCNGVTCKSGEYCSNGACLLNVTGNTYFVATNGNDNNPGTFSQPFYSWQKGATTAKAGDIIYIRGGIWQPDTHIIIGGWDTGVTGIFIDPLNYNLGASGTANSPIRIYSYPGEAPILDGSLITGSWNGGINIGNAEYIYFKGLTVENIYQKLPVASSEAYGIGSFNSANLRFENMIVHDIDGRGFQHWSGAWTYWGSSLGDFEEYYPSNFKSDNTSWINCDAYNLYDRYSDSPGNAADGFLAHGHYGNYHSFEGCRAWNYSDDGFNTFFEAYTVIKNCWAMSTNKYGGLGEWNNEGNGFKMNGVNRNRVLNYQLFGENFVKVQNSIAANCIGSGFINNIDSYSPDPENWPSNGLYYNNFGYKDWAAFFDGGANQDATRTTVFKNNIAYKSTSTNPLYEVGIYNPSVYPHSNNNWRATTDPWPGWEWNPSFTTSDSDFVSLNSLQLTAPRKADGSLPDITFGHLAQGSDLIDAGIVIPGYHCTTPGSNSGEDCVEWYGSAPDLGPFESNY